MVLRLGRQIALGLAAAHAQGLLHRDIKPANLWIEYTGPTLLPGATGSDVAAVGRIKILDFGLARGIDEESQLTHSGTRVGTPAYMAPEQSQGSSVDARCDLFGLGVVLYRMCTGRLPFPARHLPAGKVVPGAEDQPLSIRTLNPAMPAELATLVADLLARDPAKRPASAAEVAAKLQMLEGRAGGGASCASVFRTRSTRARLVQTAAGNDGAWQPLWHRRYCCH